MYVNAKIENESFVALVDTGASGFAFISAHMCNHLTLASQPIIPPIAILGFEGKTTSKVSKMATFSLNLGNHRETVSAYVIPSCKHDLVLGLPWLEKHCPYVDWKEHSITFGQSCIESSCCSFETTIPYHNTTNQTLRQVYETDTSISHIPAPPVNVSLPAPISASSFATESQNLENHTFALSLRDLDLMLEESMQRLPILRAGNATMIVPKDANPKDFLPKYYHEYLDVFDRKQANSLPPHRSWDHAIELNPGKQPPVARPYSMNQHELKALRDYLEKELSKGFIRVSRSPAAAPVLFVKKANGELRFCIDYRGLNAITIRNRHSLPLISETLSQLSKAKYYTKLDVISAFNKLRIKEGDEWKAAFTCRYGLFEPLVMPFGLCNGPASFQAYINHALQGFLDQFCTAYMDDILIYSENLNDHRGHVCKVLQRLRETGLQVDISKCSFEATEVTYLGLIVSTDGIRMDPKKVACVQEWPTPRSVRDIQRFLGFANFYRRFIPEFSRLATPLTTLTKKGVQFSWNDRCESAFFRIKQAFTDEIMLAHFDPHRQTILETDASDFVTAAILSQYDDSGKLRPIAFMSKKMLPAECNYEIFDKELLAIVNAFETWTAELGSVEASTLVLTDHKNLEYFTTTKKLNRRQVRWNELLADYDFKIVFRPGKLGGKPDALTRINADKPSNDDDIRNTHQHQTLLKPSQIISCLESAQAIPSNSPEKEPLSFPISLVEEWEEHVEISSTNWCDLQGM
ncbi:hypothetical protein K3495_g13285 [Podosphaera aphanis]|nr:hypothetical protein K3495_g13285 [Podosphaera aphanis]